MNEVELGGFAEQLLQNPAYTAGFQMVKADIFNDIARSKWFQVRKREALYRQLKAITMIEDEFSHMFNTGKAIQKMANVTRLS